MTEILEVNNKNSFEKFSYMVNYSDKDYCDDVLTLGLEKTWDNICEYLRNNGENVLGILKVDNFGELYEKGLALVDKNKKKGKTYYYKVGSYKYVNGYSCPGYYSSVVSKKR